eukprot:8270825-Alexandrium_andersonii.AAC.1
MQQLSLPPVIKLSKDPLHIARMRAATVSRLRVPEAPQEGLEPLRRFQATVGAAAISYGPFAVVHNY